MSMAPIMATSLSHISKSSLQSSRGEQDAEKASKGVGTPEQVQALV